MGMFLKAYVWLKSRGGDLRSDRGISSVEAAAIVAAAGGGALLVAMVFTDALDGLVEDFRATFGLSE